MRLRARATLIVVLLGGCASTTPLRNGKLPTAALSDPRQYVVVAVNNDAPLASARAGSTVRGYDAVAGYGASAQSERLIDALARDYRLQTVAGWPIEPLHLECVVFHVTSGPPEELIARLARDSRVKLAEPLQQFTTQSAYNDPYATLQKSLVVLGLETAHRVSRGAGVRIAVIDTGVSLDHPDLAGSVVERHDFVGGGDDAFNHDLHGTEVAGVIAARANNHLGIVGVAPESQLIALKACWQDHAMAHAVCNTFTLAQAIARAIERRARVVNLSLTGPADPLLSQLLDWGTTHGVIFVGAVAANGGLEGFPGGVRGVLAVDRAESNRRTAGVLYAPGDGILTLTPDAHYDFASGSSMAAAQVSGVLALLLERGELTAERARAILASSEGLAGDQRAGTVNACSALEVLMHRSCERLAASDGGENSGPPARHTAAAAQ